ncbi:MAG: hypothetical protein U1B30_08040, partial [Pseudomonadota bacterium]|nr:hypothetical protein [Pseudomonadota bacterium]
PTQPVLGVSTVKAIAVAAQQGQRIYTITQDNLSTALSQITLPADVETDIANAVNAGFQVTTHQTDIQYAGLVTAGYAIEDPNTGVGAMLISSGDAGGGAKILNALGIVLFTIAAAIIASLLIVLTLLLVPIFLAIIVIVVNVLIDEILVTLGTLAIIHGLTAISWSPSQIAGGFGAFFALMAFATIAPSLIFAAIFAIFSFIIGFIASAIRPARSFPDGMKTRFAKNKKACAQNTCPQVFA